MLEGKVALVIGGGRGIGSGIAMALAKAGADVAVAGRNFENVQSVTKKVTGLGRKSLALKVDVTSSNEIQAAVTQTVDTLGRLDISVHNAGVISISPLEKLEEAEWDRIMDTNAKGTFLCCKAVIPYMKQRGGGKIINLSSIAGKNGVPAMAHYCASKFAVVGLTNALAKELAGDNITVNAICPGIVKTDLWDYLAEINKLPGETREASFQRQLRTVIPQGRPQTPEDIGAMAVFLATCDNITGQAINVDGGAELH